MQTVIPDQVRGRVFTLLDVTWAAMRLVSLGLGGLLADRLGIAAVYLLDGALLALVGALGLATVRHQAPSASWGLITAVRRAVRATRPVVILTLAA